MAAEEYKIKKLVTPSGDTANLVIVDEFEFEDKKYCVGSEFMSEDELEFVLNNIPRFIFGLDEKDEVRVLDEDEYMKVSDYFYSME